MKIEQKLEKLGIKLPIIAEPIGSYVSHKQAGNLIFISGVGPNINGFFNYEGVVGEDISEEQAYEAAKNCGLNLLAILKEAIGDLDKVSQIIYVAGFVHGIAGFTKQPSIINGLSDLMLEIFGDKGKHARCAVSVNGLPLNIPVEATMIVEINE